MVTERNLNLLDVTPETWTAFIEGLTEKQLYWALFILQGAYVRVAFRPDPLNFTKRSDAGTHEWKEAKASVFVSSFGAKQKQKQKLTLFLSGSLGRIGDEGKLTSVFCRDHFHVSVGPRGGVGDLRARKYGRATKWCFTLDSGN